MPFDVSALGLPQLLLGLALAAATIAVAGVALARRADAIADRTGMGEALVGALLLGGSTSLPGIVTSVGAAWQGHPSLAIANAVGGIAVQTAFLAVGDIVYRRANLEHAAASASVLSQGALLVTLLAVPLLASAGPDVTLFGVHPGTVVLVALYLGGLHLLREARRRPMWYARPTSATVHDDGVEAPEAGERSSRRLFGQFALLALLLAAAGYAVTQFGIALSGRTGLDETAVGGVITATITSLPELVTTIAAIRHGALTLALGGVLGGNVFDTLFLAMSDVAYRGGSIYHQFAARDTFLITLPILMTGTLLLGLLRRERVGIGRIGFESAAILVFYVGGVAFVL